MKGFFYIIKSVILDLDFKNNCRKTIFIPYYIIHHEIEWFSLTI